MVFRCWCGLDLCKKRSRISRGFLNFFIVWILKIEPYSRRTYCNINNSNYEYRLITISICLASVPWPLIYFPNYLLYLFSELSLKCCLYTKQFTVFFVKYYKVEYEKLKVSVRDRTGDFQRVRLMWKPLHHGNCF